MKIKLSKFGANVVDTILRHFTCTPIEASPNTMQKPEKTLMTILCMPGYFDLRSSLFTGAIMTGCQTFAPSVECWKDVAMLLLSFT